MKKTIYIIRHGQTDFNVKQVVQGRGVNSDLNETGRRQAQAFFDKYHPVDFDVVYTSKLKRTHQTVAHFISKNIPHEIRENIDEIDWGIFEGVEHDKSLQKEYYDIIESWAKGNLTIKIEGGESAQDLADRLIPFVEEIKQSEHQSVLVCTHGRTLRVLMCLRRWSILPGSPRSVRPFISIRTNRAVNGSHVAPFKCTGEVYLVLATETSRVPQFEALRG